MKVGDLATICSPLPFSTCAHGFLVQPDGYPISGGQVQVPNGTHCLIINPQWSADSNPIVLALGALMEISPGSLRQVGR